MTPGPDGETVDGMSLGKIERIIDALRHEALQGIGESIQSSGTTYAQQEEQQQQSMSNITNALG